MHFSNGASASFGGGYLGAFCLLPGGCVCPGEETARDGVVAASPDGFVGIGPGALPQFTAQSVDEFCAGAAPSTTVAPDGPGASGCAAGVWQVDNQLMAVEFQRVVSTATPEAPPTDFVSTEVTGTWTLALGADGSMTMTASNWALAGTLLAPPGLGSSEEVTVVITITFNGTTTGRLTPAQVTGITNATQITAGGGHTCARLTDGTVRCWGYNSFGALGDGTTTKSSTPKLVASLTDVASVELGYSFSCVLRKSGAANCWGAGTSGQLGNGAILNSNTPVKVLF